MASLVIIGPGEGGAEHYHIGVHRKCRFSKYHFSVKIPESD